MNAAALARLTELDTRIVVALQRDGRASWRSVADAVGAPLTTVSRRGQQLLADGTVKVAAVPALSADGPFESYFVRINCTPGEHLTVAAQLVGYPEVRFLTVVTGSYDLMAEVIVRGGSARFAKLVSGLQSLRGIERWRSDLIMHVFKVSFDWGTQIHGELLGRGPSLGPSEVAHAVTNGAAAGGAASSGAASSGAASSGAASSGAASSGAAPGGAASDATSGDRAADEGMPESVDAPDHLCSPEHLDEADLRIVDALRQDGRERFQSIADRIGMNESSVRRRFERMRASHCIDILTLVPSAALGMGAETLLTVMVRPSALQSVAQELGRYPFVRYLAALLDENALLCEVIAPSTDDLYAFIRDSLSRLDGVQGWAASMELLYLKRGFVETPWWRAQLDAQ